MTVHASISVVITCHNHARYIGDAVASALSQSRRPAEVIVIDDGSTDHTRDAVMAFSDVKYIHQRRQGVAKARNVGLAMAASELICFLDGDDKLTRGALEVSASVIGAKPACAMAVGRCVLVDAIGDPIPNAAGPAGLENDAYAGLLRQNCIWMPAQVLFRTAALRAHGGFDPSTDHSCDYDVYMRLARSSTIAAHDHVVAEWRRHDQCASHDVASMLRSTLAALSKQRSHVASHPVRRIAYRAGRSRWRNYYGALVAASLRANWHSRDHWAAARDLFALLRYSPRSLVGIITKTSKID